MPVAGRYRTGFQNCQFAFSEYFPENKENRGAGGAKKRSRQEITFVPGGYECIDSSNQMLPFLMASIMVLVMPFLLMVRMAEVETLRVTHSPVSGR